jgi:hypothetical protein
LVVLKLNILSFHKIQVNVRASESKCITTDLLLVTFF